MMYTIFNVNNKELKLRLNARACVELEKRLGCSPLQLIMDMANGEEINMPKLETLITILHASLQAYEHGYDLNAVYDLYDEYVDNGGSLMELFPVIMEIFKVSGFFKEEQVEEAKAEAMGKPQKKKAATKK